MSRFLNTTRERIVLRYGALAVASLLLSTWPTARLAAQEGAVKLAMNSWLLCLQRNSLSAVEVTPEHAVDVAYEKCRTQEDLAIREQFPQAANDPTSMDMIRSKVRDGIKASLVKRVIDDRAGDPELHAQFADKVREDGRRQGPVRYFVREAIEMDRKDHRYGDRQGHAGPAAGWS